MQQWTLTFRGPETVEVDACRDALAALTGATVAIDRPSFSGNPRDGFFRTLYLTSVHPATGVKLQWTLKQDAWTFGEEPDATTSIGDLTLAPGSASFATMLETWRAVAAAFARQGWVDRTLVSFPRWIVDDAIDSGETAFAEQLRRDITAALIAEARLPGHRWIDLRWQCMDDLEAVLDAYAEPAEIRWVMLASCRLGAIPKALARFDRLETANLDRNALGAEAVRALAFRELTSLTMSDCQVTALQAADLAGIPRIARLDLASCPLVDLDPSIGDAYPALRNVDISNTPLGGNTAKVAILRERWPRVTFRP